MQWLEAIKTLKLPPLQSGAHSDAKSGLCAMEMVAFMERLPHSDRPECTCPVIAAYVRSINDRFDAENRQRLMNYLPHLVGTVSPEHQVARAEYIVRETVRRLVAPRFHDQFPEHEKAILSASTFAQIRDACRVARDAVRGWLIKKYGSAAADAAAYAAAAADAAAYAADSADAAAYAAAAADAADAAAYAAAAADAAAYAADAADAAAAAKKEARKRTADECLEILNGVLQIGPTAARFTHEERAQELEALTE